MFILEHDVVGAEEELLTLEPSRKGHVNQLKQVRNHLRNHAISSMNSIPDLVSGLNRGAVVERVSNHEVNLVANTHQKSKDKMAEKLAAQLANGRERVRQRLQKRLEDMEARGIVIPKDLLTTVRTATSVHHSLQIFRQWVESTKKPWTEDDVKLLNAALQKYPKTETNSKERWDLIAGEVPGRSRRACLTKFKEMRAAERDSKNAETPDATKVKPA